MSTALQALRAAVETRITGDTTAGSGLRDSDGPDGPNYVNGPFYDVAPNPDPRPSVVYKINTTSIPAWNREIWLCSVRFTVRTVQDAVDSGVDGAGDFGLTQLDNIIERLSARFSDVTLTDAGGEWTFSPFDRDGQVADKRADRELTEGSLVMQALASRSRTPPSSGLAGVTTGLGASISGTMFSASSLGGRTSGAGATTGSDTFDVNLPFAYAVSQTTATADTTRETDTFTRVSPLVSSVQIAIEFIDDIASASVPQLPLGELNALTITKANSATWTLATGSTALVTQVTAQSGADIQPVRGRYLITVNGAMSPASGPL